MKTKVISDELLVVLGSRDNQWAVLDEVAARNLQKGLVTFELTESFDRFSTQSSLRRLDIEIQIDLTVRRPQSRPLQNSVDLFLHHPTQTIATQTARKGRNVQRKTMSRADRNRTPLPGSRVADLAPTHPACPVSNRKT